MIHYYYGDGKGKSSAAFGACIRALGQGMRCAAVQFHKSGESGETGILKQLGAEVLSCGAGVKFYRLMNDDEKQALKATHDSNLRRALTLGCDMLILDELGDAYSRGAVDSGLVMQALDLSGCEVIITGHRAEDIFIKAADYVTEFKCVSHPYKRGIKARRGIEY